MNLKEAIRDVLGVREQPGDEWQCFCFSPEHDNRNSPSASVNVRKGLWVCYSCGRGGSVIQLLNGVPIAEPSVSEFLKDVERELDRLQEDGVHHAKPESWLRIYQQRDAHPEWVKRGFSQDAIDHFVLGYDYETNCLTYPLRDLDGSVLGVVRRRLDGGKPKYVYPKGIDVHQLLFRYHEATYGQEQIVLVEGALDAVALYDAGIFALAIFGGHLSAMQASLLRRLQPKRLVCAFDNDEAGSDLLCDVRQRDDLCGLNLATVVWNSAVEKDVAELSVVGRRTLIGESVDLD